MTIEAPQRGGYVVSRLVHVGIKGGVRVFWGIFFNGRPVGVLYTRKAAAASFARKKARAKGKPYWVEGTNNIYHRGN